jgi:hypothetical protein
MEYGVPDERVTFAKMKCGQGGGRAKDAQTEPSGQRAQWASDY